MFESGMKNNGQLLDVALDCVIFEAKQFDLPEASDPAPLQELAEHYAHLRRRWGL